MPHETTLIATVAAAFVVAFALGLLASKLRLPPLVGYLVAGVVIGPFTPGFVGDLGLAAQLAEIGVILLMFGVGLHFSIADLMAVRRVAIPGAIAQILTATAIGATMASIWGWGLAAGITFGLALSVASTVVLLKALEQQRKLDSPEGRIAIGWLIVEDLAMVLALVMLPAIAGTLPDQDATGGDPTTPSLWLSLATTVIKVVAFVAFALVVGTRTVPWLLTQVSRSGSRELFTLAILAIALGIAFGSAALFGVSFALGAFFAGVILSESELSQRAAEDSLPLQDAFAVLFFVSVGMLFDPSVVLRAPLEVLGVLLVIVVGKSVAAFAIMLVFRHPVGTALTVSASLAQIGEFSFILAALGVSLQLLPADARDLILAGALLSITLNPLFFALQPGIEAWLRRRPALLRALERAPATPATDSTRLADAFRDHAIVIGHGTVGRAITTALRAQSLPFVVIERDTARYQALRGATLPALHGDASQTELLQRAGIAVARVLIIAAPETFQTRCAAEAATELNPAICVIGHRPNEQELVRIMLRQAIEALLPEASTRNRHD